MFYLKFENYFIFQTFEILINLYHHVLVNKLGLPCTSYQIFSAE